MTVARRGVPLSLSPLEYRLIAYLALRRDQVVSPGELLEHLYGDDDAREANALEALVARLRRKVGPGRGRHPARLRLLSGGRRRVSWTSLRLRLVLAGGAAVLVSLTIAAIGLALLFERHVERRAVEEMSADLDQLAAGLERDATGVLEVAAPPADQRYRQPLSGRYWEILTPDGPLTSRSLWDTPLALPPEAGATGELRQYPLVGPEGEELLVIERRLLLPERAGGTTVRAAVAMDRAELRVASRDFLRDLAPYLGLLAATLIAAGWAQVAVGLKPLKAVGARVAAVRSGAAARLGGDFPDEVRPLAAEVDELIAAREADIAGARARAADLAHGLKTPLQALFGEARLLAARGEGEAAEGIEEVVTAMRRHVDRELSRARIATAGRTATCDARAVIDRVLAVLRRTPSGAMIDWRQRGTEGLALRIEADDLTEALGAVLENAGAHARSEVEIAAARDGAMVEIRIRDNGPGVAEPHLAELAVRGIRLDAKGPGAGLGLAIATEICAAAGGSLSLRNADPRPRGHAAPARGAAARFLTIR